MTIYLKIKGQKFIYAKISAVYQRKYPKQERKHFILYRKMADCYINCIKIFNKIRKRYSLTTIN